MKTPLFGFGTRGAAVFLSLAGTAVLPAAQTVVFNDDMSSSTYPGFAYNASDTESNMDDISYESTVSQSSGGNPGAYLGVMHTLELMDGAENNQVFVQSIYERSDISYTPTVSGAIQSLAFSIDVRSSDPFTSLGFVVSGSGGNLAGFTSFTTDGEWHTVTVSGLTQADFPTQDFSGSTSLHFGFSFLSDGSLSDDGNGVFTPEIHIVDVDNFVVTATLVPEVSSAMLLGLGCLGFAFRRRR